MVLGHRFESKSYYNPGGVCVDIDIAFRPLLAAFRGLLLPRGHLLPKQRVNSYRLSVGEEWMGCFERLLKFDAVPPFRLH